MRRRILALLTSVVVSMGLLVTVPVVADTDVATEEPLKIMAIGDSITHGNGRQPTYFHSYRYPLWKLLIDANANFEMVGPWEGQFNANCTNAAYKSQTFNNKHYARYGERLEYFKNNVTTDCAGIDVDIAIIHLGTNDRKTSNDTEKAWTNETLPAWMGDLVTGLRTLNPNVVVFITGLNDVWPGGLNEAYEAKAKAMSTSSSPVYYIAPPTGWVKGSVDTHPDTVHPTDYGSERMAKTYFDFMMENYLLPNGLAEEIPEEEPEEAPDFEDVEAIYTEDFEGDTSSWAIYPQFADKPVAMSVVADGGNKALQISDESSWTQYKTQAFVSSLDPSKTYTISLKTKGDHGWFGLVPNEIWDIQAVDRKICGVGVAGDGSHSEWTQHAMTFTGLSTVKFAGQVQCTNSIAGMKAYVDDIVIYEGDYVDEIINGGQEDTPVATTAPTATPAVSDEATTAPTAVVGTAAPTVTPTSTPKPPKKVTIKFKKKSVKIKKGKKVTLKVTIKNAKKATFSVDKKGKKIVKLSKKKAKSVVVKGNKKGKAIITAKAGNKKVTCKVKVK